MNESKIPTGNKLIAEFMGWKTHPKFGDEYVINKDLKRKAPYWSDVSYQCMRNELDYHSSWDWLMLVVEKIESLVINEAQPKTSIDGFHITSTNQTHHRCIIRLANLNSDGNNQYLYEGGFEENKLIAVYKAVVEFIKWYNKQK